MAELEVRPPPARRRRGRPVGSDSAETRNRILAAARQVINERGYQAATFQAIAAQADLSRPTLHYYFESREQIYQVLVVESAQVLTDCMAEVPTDQPLVERLSAFISAVHAAYYRDRSQIAFLVSARLEANRNPDLRTQGGAAGLRAFLTSLVSDAVERGEIPADVGVSTVAELLDAMMWGIGFYAGFIDDAADMLLITQQLDGLISRGLPAKDTCGDTPRTVGSRP